MTPNFDAATKTMQSATEQGRAALEAMVQTSQAQMTEAQAKMTAQMSDLAAESRANMEALMKAGDIVLKAMNVVGTDTAAFLKAQAEKNIEAGKAMMGVKSVDELVTLQTNAVKGNVEALYAESIKASKTAASVARDAFAPIGDRMNATMERYGRPFAA